MSFWVEVHCDVRSMVVDPSRPWDDHACWSFSNSHPSVKATNIESANRWVVQDAKRQGWKRLRSGDWSCPHCQKFPPLGTSTASPA